MRDRRGCCRTHLLRPDTRFNELYQYCLAVLSERHGIDVHAAVVMSTHEHLIVTDPLGRLPLFLRELHRVVALGVKVLRKWEGAVGKHAIPRRTSLNPAVSRTFLRNCSRCTRRCPGTIRPFGLHQKPPPHIGGDLGCR